MCVHVLVCEYVYIYILYIHVLVCEYVYIYILYIHVLVCEYVYTVGVKLKFPVGFRSTELKRYTILTKKQLQNC